MNELPRDFFEGDADAVARALLGVTLLVDGVGGRIVETEAYDVSDPSSHSFRGATPRNAPMFGPPGRAYVYRIYGLHWCLNMVCGRAPGSAVLIRAIEPQLGHSAMRQRRGDVADRLWCSGPGRLAQALGVEGALNGADLYRPPFALTPRDRAPDIVAGPRIGISKAAERPRRFCIRASPYLSKPARP